MSQEVRHVQSTTLDAEEAELADELARYDRAIDPCILTGELVRMHDGKVDAARTAEIEEHLAHCSWCSGRLQGWLYGRDNPIDVDGPSLPGSAGEELNTRIGELAQHRPPAKKPD